MRRLQLQTTGATSSALATALSSLCATQRMLTINGRVTNEDRRWWLVHLECSPDVTPGTFITWLDCCGTHTTKKLIERNVWTVEQVAALDSDTVDSLKYSEGCLKMDIVWEHARTVIGPLKQREVSGGVESELQDRIQQLRKKRELERRREEIISDRVQTSADRESTLEKLRADIAAKKAALLKKQQEMQQQRQGSGGVATEPTAAQPSVGDVMNDMNSGSTQNRN